MSKELENDVGHNIIISNDENDIAYKLNDDLENEPDYAFTSELDDDLANEPDDALANK